MERSLLLAAAAAVAFGLLRELEARRLRAAGAPSASAGGEAPAGRAALAGASARGLVTAGLGGLGLGAVCRLAPGRPEVLAVFSLWLSLAVLAAGVRLPGDSPRWPAVLSTDLLASFAAAAAAALVLAEDPDTGDFVLGLAAAGLLASMAGAALAARACRAGEPGGAPELGCWAAALLTAAAALPLSWLAEDGLPAFGAAVCGVLAGLLAPRPAAGSRPAWLWPAAVSGGTAAAAWYLCGPLGLALAALGMTAPAAALGAADGPGLPCPAGGSPGEEGAPARAPGRAPAAAALAALALLAAWADTAGPDTSRLFLPAVALGLLLGAVFARRSARSPSAGLAAGGLVRLACGAALVLALLTGR